MGATFKRRYATLFVAGTTAIDIPIIKRNVVDFALSTDWTPAAGDVVVNIDNAGAANITNLPTAIAMGHTYVWRFILTAAELTGKNIKVAVCDAATKAVEDQMFIIETFGSASAMYAQDFDNPFQDGIVFHDSFYGVSISDPLAGTATHPINTVDDAVQLCLNNNLRNIQLALSAGQTMGTGKPAGWGWGRNYKSVAGDIGAFLSIDMTDMEQSYFSNLGIGGNNFGACTFDDCYFPSNIAFDGCIIKRGNFNGTGIGITLGNPCFFKSCNFNTDIGNSITIGLSDNEPQFFDNCSGSILFIGVPIGYSSNICFDNFVGDFTVANFISTPCTVIFRGGNPIIKNLSPTAVKIIIEGVRNDVRDIKALLSNSSIDGLIKFVDANIGNDINQGDSWGAGHAYHTIGAATSAIAAAGNGGTIFVLANSYTEDVVVPDNTNLIGIAANIADKFAEITGLPSGSTGPSLTLGYNSKAIGIRVGKASGYSTCAIMMKSKSSFLDGSTGGINIPVSSILCADTSSFANELEIKRNWISGSDKAVSAVGGDMANSEISENTFIQVTGNHIVATGELIDIDLNTFNNIAAGTFAISSAADFVTITHNVWNGAPTAAFHDDVIAIGHNHIVHDNENTATFDQVDFLRKLYTNRKAIKKILGQFYQQVYDDSDLDADVILDQLLLTFDGGTIGDLAGTTKPSIRNKSSV